MSKLSTIRAIDELRGAEPSGYPIYLDPLLEQRCGTDIAALGAVQGRGRRRLVGLSCCRLSSLLEYSLPFPSSADGLRGAPAILQHGRWIKIEDEPLSPRLSDPLAGGSISRLIASWSSVSDWVTRRNTGGSG